MKVCGRIDVLLTMAGVDEFHLTGLVGRLLAVSESADDASGECRFIETSIYMNDGGDDFRFETFRGLRIFPDAAESRLRAALHVAWHTGHHVDIRDEEGRPLLAGSPYPVPGGLGRWLGRYPQFCVA